MQANPIILKECLQAARRVRTYAVRAALPAGAIMLLVPSLSSILRRQGQDWGAISRISRSIFETTAWFELIAFSLMAFGYCSMTIREEWRHKTMEVLCASPLSRFQIVYGKFVAVLSKLIMAALALLPVMGIWFHLGRIPREMVLGTFAVILGSILLFGSMALLQAACFRPGKTYWLGTVGIILPYFLVLILLDIGLPRRHPLPDAAIPVLALARVLRGRATKGWSAGHFAWLSFGVQAGVSLLALSLAPWFFGRSFTRHVSADPKRQWFPTLRKFLEGRRPPMEPSALPSAAGFSGTVRRWLVWALWPIYGFTIGVFIVDGLVTARDFAFLAAPFFYDVLAIEGAVALVLAGIALSLTPTEDKAAGSLPQPTAFGRLWAAYGRLKYAILVAALAQVGFVNVKTGWHHTGYDFCLTVLLFLGILLGPAIGLLLGTLLRELFRRRDPFTWQEQGAPTWLVRRALWLVYGITFLIAFAVAIDHSSFGFLDDDDFYILLLVEGLVTIGLASLFYGASVFAREKSHWRAEALLLTGCSPSRFFFAKIRALYWALRYSIAAVLLTIVGIALCGSFRHFDFEEWFIILGLIGQGIIFGPGFCAVIGMAFSVLAKSTTRAVMAIAGAVCWGCLIGWVLAVLEILRFRWTRQPLIPMSFLLGATACVVVFARAWKPWRLGLVLALNFFIVLMGLIQMDRMFRGDTEEIMMTVVGSAMTWVFVLGWFWLGLRLFDPGMAGAEARLWRRRR